MQRQFDAWDDEYNFMMMSETFMQDFDGSIINVGNYPVVTTLSCTGAE